MKKYQRLIVSLTLLLGLSLQSIIASSVFGWDMPSAPTLPSAPQLNQGVPSVSVPSMPSAPELPTAPDTGLEAPSLPQAPSVPSSPPDTNSNSDQNDSNNNSGSTGDSQGSNSSTSGNEGASTNNSDPNDSNSGNSGDQNVGDSSVSSGDAGVSALLENNLNNNQTSLNCEIEVTGCTDSSESLSSTNSDNGSGSTNDSTVDSNNSTNVNNDNNLNLTNSTNVDVNTGNNSASENVGNGTVTSGDADIIFTNINTGNNNIVGGEIQEFNVFDNQTGDIVFQFSDPASIGANTIAQNSGNGSDSENNSAVNSDTSTDINNNNNAVVQNDVNLIADTGDNDASKNTGSGNITTGDANIIANLLNFLNNNIVAGIQWLLGVVNIFGTLEGDIVLSGDNPQVTDGSGVWAANTGNGAGSTNNTSTNTANQTNIDLANQATILNDINIDGSTGNNSTNKNNGNSSVTTGDVNANVQVLNLANMNLVVDESGVIWLVLVNNQGQWTGSILGSPSGATVAGSNLEFEVLPDGTIVAKNVGNGSGSVNNASVDSSNTTNIQGSNTANLVNNLNIDASTGGNSADKNVGGANIQTGDVNIAANIINFINNNFVGKKLMIAVVNNFGNWIGSLIPPGFKKVPDTTQNAEQNLTSLNDDKQSSAQQAPNAQAPVSTTSQSVVSAKGSANKGSVGGNLQGLVLPAFANSDTKVGGSLIEELPVTSVSLSDNLAGQRSFPKIFYLALFALLGSGLLILRRFPVRLPRRSS